MKGCAAAGLLLALASCTTTDDSSDDTDPLSRCPCGDASAEAESGTDDTESGDDDVESPPVPGTDEVPAAGGAPAQPGVERGGASGAPLDSGVGASGSGGFGGLNVPLATAGAGAGGASVGEDDTAPDLDAGPTLPDPAELMPPADSGVSSEVDSGVSSEVDSCVCSDAAALPACECNDCEEAVSVTSAFHVTGPIDYGEHAPAGGDHAGCWGEWGVHTSPLPAENFVHNLEHGGVAFLYHCPDGCAAEVAVMQAFVAANELTVLTEYDGMLARFAVVSWGYRLESECFDALAFERFYATHVDRAPEQFGRPPPAPPAACQ